jgi:hypothetical protein
MNSLQIESWALRVIDCVDASQPNEDTRIELKREWIGPQKAARMKRLKKMEGSQWLPEVDANSVATVNLCNPLVKIL